MKLLTKNINKFPREDRYTINFTTLICHANGFDSSIDILTYEYMNKAGIPPNTQ